MDCIFSFSPPEFSRRSVTVFFTFSLGSTDRGHPVFYTKSDTSLVSVFLVFSSDFAAQTSFSAYITTFIYESSVFDSENVFPSTTPSGGVFRNFFEEFSVSRISGHSNIGEQFGFGIDPILVSSTTTLSDRGD